MKYELTISPNYNEHWGWREAIRELIQNGVDSHAKDETNEFSLVWEDGGNTLKFINTKSKLDINTLLLGGTDKQNDRVTIGHFGEGYKVASLVLLRLGCTFTVYNYLAGEKWVATFEQSSKWADALILTYTVTKIKPRDIGLVIVVGNINAVKTSYEYSDVDVYDIDSIWLSPDSYAMIGEQNIIKTSYGDVITDPEYKGKLYVNGLFVEDSDTDYGYNFKAEYMELDRDRRACPWFDRQSTTSNMLGEAYCAGLIDSSAFNNLVVANASDVHYMGYGYCGGDGNSETINNMLIENFKTTHPGENVIPCNDDGSVAMIKALGGTPVKVEYNLYKFLRNWAEQCIAELKAVPVAEDMSIVDRLTRFGQIYRKDWSIDCKCDFDELVAQIATMLTMENDN